MIIDSIIIRSNIWVRYTSVLGVGMYSLIELFAIVGRSKQTVLLSATTLAIGHGTQFWWGGSSLEEDSIIILSSSAPVKIICDSRDLVTHDTVVQRLIIEALMLLRRLKHVKY